MSRQIILRAVFAILVVFSFANLASAQLKPSGSSNKVLVDLSVIDGLSAGRSPSQTLTVKGKEGGLLKPPSKMPRSHFLVKRPTARNLRKLSRIKLKPIVKTHKKRFKRGIASKKTKPLRSKSRVFKQQRPKTKTRKSQSTKKLLPIPKQDRKSPIKLSKATPKDPVINKPVLAPAPKASPKAPVKILPAPPLKPIIGKTRAKTKPISLKASRSKNTYQQSRAKLLIFHQGDAKLTVAAKKTLDTLSAKLKVEPNSRMQLQAYAGEPNLSASRARRLSLKRALSARSYLINKGIRSTRIDVRALGNKTSVGEPNRVELKLIKN